MKVLMGNIWKYINGKHMELLEVYGACYGKRMETYEKPGECWENEMILELAMEVCGIYGKKTSIKHL